MKVVFRFVCNIVGNTFTLEGILVEYFKETADTFAVIIEFGIQARALDAAEGEGIVDVAFFGTATSSIVENRATKCRITSDTSVIVENKIFTFITGTMTGVFIENGANFTLTDIIEEKSEERILNVTSDTLTKAGCDKSSVTLALVSIGVDDKEVIGVTGTFFGSSIEFTANAKVASVIISKEVVSLTFTRHSPWS